MEAANETKFGTKLA